MHLWITAFYFDLAFHESIVLLCLFCMLITCWWIFMIQSMHRVFKFIFLSIEQLITLIALSNQFRLLDFKRLGIDGLSLEMVSSYYDQRLAIVFLACLWIILLLNIFVIQWCNWYCFCISLLEHKLLLYFSILTVEFDYILYTCHGHGLPFSYRLFISKFWDVYQFIKIIEFVNSFMLWIYH